MTRAVRVFPASMSALLLTWVVAACSSSSNGGTNPNNPPAAPTNVAASAKSGSSVVVTFDPVDGATGYKIERKSGTGDYAQVGGNAATNCLGDVGLAPGTQYTYRVVTVKNSDTSDASGEVSATTAAANYANGGAEGLLACPIVANRNLTADTTYLISGFPQVENGATLAIAAGTKLVGDTAVVGSSLWILRGAKIDAEGTSTNPIVFTSGKAAGSRRPGDWGGIVIVGNGIINRSGTIFTEGPSALQQPEYSGGTDNNDNSGTLKYVRIEFAGLNAGTQDLNSLSSYAVGRGTTYDYIQSMASLDDAFEFFGGAVDARHIVSYESGDDHIDWTEGFSGRIQFLIGLQTTVIPGLAAAGTTTSPDPRGFEGDGCDANNPGCSADFSNTPFSMPLFANFAVIGPGPGVFTVNDGDGAVIRFGSGGTFVNGIIGRWPGVGISLRDFASEQLRQRDSVTFRNNILSDNGTNFEPAGTHYGALLNDTTYHFTQVTGVTGLFTALPAAGVEPTVATLDWSPTGSAQTGGLSDFTNTAIAGRTAGFFGGSLAGSSFQGPDDSNAPKWWTGWTVYYRN